MGCMISEPIIILSDVAEVEELWKQECTDYADSTGLSLCDCPYVFQHFWAQSGMVHV